MAGRMRLVFWAFCRGWLFGVVLGLVLGGGLGTFFIPVVGSFYGGLIGVALGVIVGPASAALVAPAALFPPSVAGDRIWPGVVATVLTYLLCTKVVFSRASGWFGWSVGDAFFLACLACVAGALSVTFGVAVTRGERVRFLRSPKIAAAVGVVGALVGAGRVIELEGWSEPGFLVGLTLGGFAAGGILGLTIVALNLLVTKEPAEQ